MSRNKEDTRATPGPCTGRKRGGIMVTVWEFKSVDGKQVKRVMRNSEPLDDKYQHAYQRILYRGMDYQLAKTFTN